MWKKIQKNLIVGFMSLLPAIVTIYVIQLLFSIIDRFLGQFLSDILKALNIIKVDEGSIYFLGAYTPFSGRIIGIGFILTIIIISIIGSMKRSGKKQHLFDKVDHFFRKIPFASYLYSSVEQMINAFTQERSSFKEVVMIEYPRKGIYTLGFLTGKSKGEVQIRAKKECLNIFLPTTPNPTSGWLVLVPEEDVIVLDMSIEQGLKFIISGGVVVPPFNAELLNEELGENLEAQLDRNELVIHVNKRKDE
jgi:uncharacterized membrane protein